MKIVFDARFLSVPGTGIASYTEGLVSGIDKLDNISNDEYLLLVPNEIDLKRKDIKFKIVNVSVVTLQQHILMPFYLLGIKPDIYHYPHFDLPFGLNIPSVITIYDLKYIKIPGLFYRKAKFKSWLMKTIMRNSLRQVRKVITLSKSSKEDIVNIFNVAPDKIEVIYAACDPSYKVISSPLDFVLKKYQIQLPFLLFVGEIRPHKNLVNLIKVFKNIKYKNYALVIVGKTYRNYREPFTLVAKLGLDNRVRFLGYVPKMDLVSIYNAATLFILPSLYEGFGLPVLEAMACGTPVVTSNISSLPEITGDAAILIDPYDKDSIIDSIESILDSPSLRQTLRERGLKRVQDFSWSMVAEKTIKLYKEAYNEGKI